MKHKNWSSHTHSLGRFSFSLYQNRQDVNVNECPINTTGLPERNKLISLGEDFFFQITFKAHMTPLYFRYN